MHCPYCQKEIIIASKDHVFSQFLNGTTKVTVCKDCNSKFGYTFEKEVCNDIAPLIVSLGYNGLKVKEDIVWKNAFINEENGLSYDLRPGWKVSLSKPHIVKDSTGKIKEIVADIDQVKSMERSVKKLKTITKVVTTEIKPPKLNAPKINIDGNFRRLVLKIAIATTVKNGIDFTNLISDEMRSYLHDQCMHTNKIKIDFTDYDFIDSQCPDLAHFAFVCGSEEYNYSFAIVKLYGTFQFYILLNENYSGHSFACIGIHNNIDGSEVFSDCKHEIVSEPPSIIQTSFPQQYLQKFLVDLDRQIYNEFGGNVIYFGGQDPSSLYY